MKSISNTSNLSLTGRSFWTKQLVRALTNMPFGRLDLSIGSDTWRFGEQTEPYAQVHIKDEQALKQFLLGGSLGAASAYIDGLWDSPDLTQVIRLFARNLSWLDGKAGKLNKVMRPILRFGHWLNRNSKQQARKNIADHYDLGNALYERFLDSSMMYSAAIFPHADSSLEEAQQYRLARICEKLDLRPGQSLIEIGTGWGSMAIFAAQHYGAKVTTTTLSQEQFNYTQARVKALGLEDKVQVLLSDYRDLTGQYDRLVSIEMIEAVGEEYLNGYFRKCSELLKEDGRALIQGITISDQRYPFYKKHVDFIQKYIFPGGHLPSITRMMNGLTQSSDLVLRHLEDFGEHYAQTLALWHQQFERNWDDIKHQGYDEHFRRLWRYYLCYCEGGFAERTISVVQLVLAKPQDKTPALLGMLPGKEA